MDAVRRGLGWRAYSPRWGKSTVRWAIRSSGRLLGRVLPLSSRQALVAAAGRRKMTCGLEFAMGMLHDLHRRDPVGLHRFLWSNHLAYAQTYEVHQRFGAANINPTRHLLFRNLTEHLRARGADPGKDVQSVFEVGCSMGYLLHHVEKEVFPSATILHGIDIDEYAVRTGSAHLSSLGSRVQLFAADMESAEDVMSGRKYDLVLCCGVLMYVNEAIAEKVVRTIFANAGRLVGLICLARLADECGCPGVRTSDGAFIHNVDQMIRRAGGRVVSADWVDTSVSGSSPSHVIVAEPGALS
jgi:SAM-dependent methyltransferase